MQVRILPREIARVAKTVKRLNVPLSLIPRPSATKHSGKRPVRKQFMEEHKLITLTKPGDGQSLCRTCYWAHAQKGFRESEELIFCAFGPLRKLPFPVRECTDYLNRTLPTRSQMEKIALIIPSEPARKPTGFSSAGFAAVAEDNSEDEQE